jgi:hypothetical protein
LTSKGAREIESRKVQTSKGAREIESRKVLTSKGGRAIKLLKKSFDEERNLFWPRLLARA